MPKIVEVPGEGNVEFPDSMSDADIAAAIQKQTAPAPPSVGGFISNLGSSAARFAGDVVAPITHPQETLAGVTGLLEGMAEKSGFKPVAGVSHAKNVDAFIDLYKHRYGSFDALKNTLYADPVGAAADFAALASGGGAGAKSLELAGQAGRLGRIADVAGTVAKAADVAGSVTDPLRVVGRGAGAITAPVAEAAANYLRGRALKGGYDVGFPNEKVIGTVQAMGEQRIPFSTAGVATATQAAEDLRSRINTLIQPAAEAGMTIDREAVLRRLDEFAKEKGKQATPEQDLRAIEAKREEFARTRPAQIPIEQAQEMKVGTNKEIGAKFGEQSQASIDAEKALARGLKEELEVQIPELAALNAKQAKFIDLENILGKAVNKYANSGGFTSGVGRQLLGWPGALVTAAVGGPGLYVGHGGEAAALLAARAVLSDPKVKAMLANGINLAQQANPNKFGAASMATAASRVEEYLKALGASGQQPQILPASLGNLSPADAEAAFQAARTR